MSKWRALLAAALSLGLVVSLSAHSRATTSVATDGSGAVTVSKEVTRSSFDANGVQTVVDDRTVTATVSQTLNLADRQTINVSWSGAHPTGARVADPSGLTAAFQEFPFMITECRGVDTAAQPLDPSTCWTYSTADRYALDTESAYPSWRLDHFATAAQRASSVNVPSGCGAPEAKAERYQPFVGVDGTSYPFGPGGPPCGQSPPEVSSDPDTAPLPTNNQFAFTDARGNGTTSFEIRASESYASLGCSDTVPCSIVMVPIEGISCDAGDGGSAADLSLCESTGTYAPGQPYTTSNDMDRPSVTGQEWWSPSNWQNRMSVPLTFRASDNVCDIKDTRLPTDLYGSEIASQATAQWAPYFCLDPTAFKFRHIHLGEPPARALLAAGNIAAALVTQPTNNYTTPTVNAPIAIGGFGIAFTIDKADGSGLTQTLKLTPRLVAKALTESYPADPAYVQPNDAPLTHNPLNMAQDPEFKALNPGLISTTDIDESTIINLSSDSDTEYALTSWINSDPDARAWLNGRPDPWGMVVNPNYKGISLPTYSWPLLDNFIVPYPKDVAGRPTTYTCYNTNPAPFGNLVAAPTGTLSNIAEDVQYVHPTTTLGCSPGETTATYGLQRSPRETAGVRFILGLVSIADAKRYGLSLASLQSQVLPNAAEKFTDATGRVFVQPTDDSLRAAAAELKPSATVNAWTLSYEDLATDPAAVAAYPGMLPVYAQVPTTGLSAADASHLATLLRFAAGRGQQQGTDNGDLPAGYLPLTAANGLGALVQYTLTAADAVGAQLGTVPQVVPQGTAEAAGSAPAGTTASVAKSSAEAKHSAPSSTPGSTSTPVSKPAVGTGEPAAAAPVSGSPVKAALPSVARTLGGSAPAPSHAPGLSNTAVIRVPGDTSDLAGILLPLILLVLLLGVLAGPVITGLDRRRVGQR